MALTLMKSHLVKISLTESEVETVLQGCRDGIRLEKDTLSEGPDAWSKELRKEFRENLRDWQNVYTKLRRAKMRKVKK